MTIFTIFVGLLVSHYIGNLDSIRHYGWIEQLHTGLARLSRNFPALLQALTPILAALGLLYLLDRSLASVFGSLFEWILAVFVFLYCLGPRDIRKDTDQIIHADSDHTIGEYLSPLFTEPLADNQLARNEQAIGSVFQAGLQRWFSVIFWFTLLGIYGALAYRACSQLVTTSAATGKDSSASQWLARLQKIAEWPVAQLMTLAIALAADFDTVYNVWKRYLNEKGDGLKTGDYGFMLQAAVVAIQGASPAGVGVSKSLSGSSGTVQIAMDLLHRVLLVWLVILMIILVASWLL